MSCVWYCISLPERRTFSNIFAWDTVTNVQKLYKVIRLKGKQVRSQLGILFFKTCLEPHVVPTNIKERVGKMKSKHPYSIEKAFIRDELEEKMDFLGEIAEDYKPILSKVCAQLSSVDRLRFCKLLNQTTERLVNKSRRRMTRQCDDLLSHSYAMEYYDTLPSLIYRT